MTTARSSAPLVSLRGATAGLSMFAGSVHLMVGAQRGALWSAEATALAAWGVVQVGVAILLLTLADRRLWWAISITGTLAASAWLFTRTVGYPFGPVSTTPSVAGLEAAVAAAELIGAALAGSVVLSDGRLGGPIGLRFENIGPLLIAAASLPGIAGSTWLEQYAFDPALGTVHLHTATTGGLTVLTAAERATLGREIETTRDIALQHPTLAEAEASGLVIVGQAALGVGVQAFDPTLPADAPFSIDTPRAWIYADDSPDAPVAGLLYDTVGADAPEGFTGGDDPWHLHPGECTITLPDGSELAVSIDPVVTGNDCGPIDGTLATRAHWMLRVWSVPGWDSPAGVFAHDHPGLPAR